MSDRRNTDRDKGKKARDILYQQPKIEELIEEFGLSEDAEKGAVLIYRILVGLGKGLSKTQKSSYAALAVRIAAEHVDDEKPLKKNLAEAIGTSLRTLSRRFKEVTEDEEAKLVLNYLEKRIEKWSRRKERRLQDIL
ncbi:hypothetical protein AKJ52_01470 [candidate division MSBL1 archaeon SCGC-AAA382C18]|uniref:Transcription factor TFIIB cyclin-like domain-containing protein n=1 Tax=candidate division MSBL1 archaeon SCGC-AAA382C18 TaxID=1698281 RepID=A0A133VK73_9EURY|nr:hypothetical protein AKJ52_01470 [candidate division MSBL1 archaeon SCGC-AAA382C18]